MAPTPTHTPSRLPAFLPSTFCPSRPPLSPLRLRHISRPPIRCAASPPKRIAAVAKDLQHALQSSLLARTSRIRLCLPAAAKLGTEKRPADEDVVARRHAGNRELARLVAGMFSGTGLSVRVVFPAARERSRAEKVWGPGLEYRVEDWGKGKGGGKGNRNRNRGGGFGDAKGEVEVEDVHLMVGGGAAFAEKVRRFAQEVGMDKLVIVVNANSEGDQLPMDLERFGEDVFESVYHYEPNPHPRWSGGVLFRKFPDDWVLCRLSGLGMLQQLLISREKPSLEQVRNALAEEEQKPSLLNKISTFIDRNAP